MSARVLLGLGGVLLVSVASLWVGPTHDRALGEFIFWQLRLPRTLVGLLVGSSLGLTGAAFQALFGNGLATPSTVGTTAGATLGALAALVFGSGASSSALPLVTLFAFAGALGASSIVSSVAIRGSARINDVLLAGIAVSLATGAFSQAVQAVADMNALFAATQWSLGQLPQVGFDGVVLLTPFCAVGALLVLTQTRGLQALTLGEQLAHSQGVSIARVRALVLIGGSLGVAACVAWCGPIAFVGLIVPHIVRKLTGPSLRLVLPFSAVFGSGFLVLCDLVARNVMPDRELPVGVLTASLGAPVLFFLVLRR